MSSLAGKIALITGSSSGIGQGIAEHFATLGARVVVHGHEEAAARAVAGALAARGHAAAAVAGDLVDVDVCRGIVRQAVDHYGGIDILVNNAAMTTRGYLEDVAVEVWDALMHVNLRAPFVCLQAVIPHMKARGGGSIVNIGSVNAYIGEPKLGAYSVSKGGLMTLTKNAASALGQYRIRVNQLNVGWTLTEGEDRVKRLEGLGDTWLADAVATRPFGRLLSPHDVAQAAAYFASDAGAMVSGAVLDLDQFPVGAPPDL